MNTRKEVSPSSTEIYTFKVARYRLIVNNYYDTVMKHKHDERRRLMAAKRKRRKIIFKGTGFGWFPMPRYFLGDKTMRGKFFQMAPSPDLRLYVILLSELGKDGNPIGVLENSRLMEAARLNRTYLPRARKALVQAKLIRATRAGMKAYRYEILGKEGRPLWDRDTDESSDLEFAFQTR
jgi:hypothetical protein